MLVNEVSLLKLIIFWDLWCGKMLESFLSFAEFSLSLWVGHYCICLWDLRQKFVKSNFLMYTVETFSLKSFGFNYGSCESHNRNWQFLAFCIYCESSMKKWCVGKQNSDLFIWTLLLELQVSYIHSFIHSLICIHPTQYVY